MSQIKVVISDERGSVETTTTGTSTNATAPSTSGSSIEKKESQKSAKGMVIASTLVNQAINLTTSNIGKWTGSTRNQQSINNVMQVGTIATMSIVSPALALATFVANASITAINTSYEQKWDTRQQQYNRAKVGELKGFGH